MKVKGTKNYVNQMKKAMESLRWVAYEEVCGSLRDEDDDEEVKPNDTTESTETDDKTDEDVSARSSQDGDSESAEIFEGEG